MKKFSFKNKEKNKINNIVLLIFLSIGIIVAIFNIMFDKENKKIVNHIDPNDIEVSIYETKDNRILNYNTFFSVEDIIKNIFKNLQDKKYDLVYNLLSQEYKNIITLEQFTQLVENYILNFNINNKRTSGRLNFLYEIEKSRFLADADYLFVDNKINIIINISNDKYVIEYFDVLRGNQYE